MQRYGVYIATVLSRFQPPTDIEVLDSLEAGYAGWVLRPCRIFSALFIGGSQK